MIIVEFVFLPSTNIKFTCHLIIIERNEWNFLETGKSVEDVTVFSVGIFKFLGTCCDDRITANCVINIESYLLSYLILNEWIILFAETGKNRIIFGKLLSQ